MPLDSIVKTGWQSRWGSRKLYVSENMSVKKIQIGQVWRKVGSDETFLVTRLYTEVLTTIAVLRPTGNETAAMLRIKIESTPAGQMIPGFSMAQDSDA